MTHFLRTFAVTSALLLPVGAAQALQCPAAPDVFSHDGGQANLVSLAQLSDTVGHVKLEGDDLRKLSRDIQADYPNANKPEIADVMITAYCNFLSKDTPENHRSQTTVHRFEQQVYKAVFGGPPPPDYKRQGWLFEDGD